MSWKDKPTYDELVAALRAALNGHSKQCMGYDDCRVCQTGGYDVLDRVDGHE